MNAFSMARTAYGAGSTPVRTERGIEYEAFARVTGRLRGAVNLGRQGFAQLAEALHDNRMLWTTLAGCVADPENRLPEALRARIFYLHEFTDHHSARVLDGTASADALIDINTAIMRGLNQGEQPT